ncbi:O-antigen ligase family protein [Gorillibacterium massiliense]|uniref:O-antigen ligase family protein n=1 Tax=Gorillibacterium massiliense TaxID=1280390 RepID=UPI0004B2B1C0|nr:O-antigen ligase family protein [Gorillibacterium massiliense]
MENATNRRKTDQDAEIMNSDRSSILYWTLLFCVMAFVFIAPYQTALFNNNTIVGRIGDLTQYEGKFFGWLLVGFGALLVVGLRFFSNWKLKDSRDWLSILIWLIPLCYFISMSQAVSPHLAKNMLLINIFYAALFVAAIVLARTRFGSTILQNGLLISGYIIVWFGLACLLGMAYHKDALMSDQGLRLTSVFQYANAYAAFLLVLLVACIYSVVCATDRKIRFLHMFMIVPIIVSFLLTLSRGGLVVLPVILLIVVPFLPVVRQLFMLVYTLVGAAAALAVTSSLNKAGQNTLAKVLPTAKGDWTASLLGWKSGDSWFAFVILVVVSFAVTALIYASQRFVEPRMDSKLAGFSSRKYARFALPLLFIIIGIIGFLLVYFTPVKDALPDTLRTRVENINFRQHSVLERGYFYKDAFKLIADYPVLGAGGGAWGTLYGKYQSYPYISRQAHSFPIQYMLETGIIGFIVLLLVIGLAFYLFVRHYIKVEPAKRDQNFVFFIVSVALLLHSLIDFELSYIYLAGLLFLCLGGMVAGADSVKLLPVPKRQDSPWRYLFPGALAAIAITAFVMTSISLSANASFKKANRLAVTTGSLDQVVVPLNRAISRDPGHPDYRAQDIQYYQQVYQQMVQQGQADQATQYLQAILSKTESALRHEPNSQALLNDKVSIYTSIGQYNQALDTLNQSLILFPWDESLYAQKMQLEAKLAAAADQKDPAVAEQYRNDALTVYDAFNKRVKDMSKIPKEIAITVEFKVTPLMAASLGQIYFQQGHFDKAMEILKPTMGTDSPERTKLLDTAEGREAALWYLATLNKQQQNDENLHNLLISKDETEKVKLDTILK